uniref:Uncharacterized protein n=1 Tax=Lotharella globosa TaxID=91324 RepID=A0A7S3ZDA3_9EUKA
MANHEEDIAQLEREIEAAHEERKRLLTQESKLKQKIALRALVSPRLKTPRSPRRFAQWEEELAKQETAKEELVLLEAETTRLRSAESNDVKYLGKLSTQQEALTLIHSQWANVEAAITRIFTRDRSRDGTMDMTKVLNKIRSSSVACLASLPQLESVVRPRLVTRDGLLNRLRPRRTVKAKKNSDKGQAAIKVKRLRAGIEDLERATEMEREKIKELKQKLQDDQLRFKAEAAELRRLHEEAVEDCARLQKRYEEESQQGDQNDEQLEALAEEDRALGPGPLTPEKHGELAHTFEALQEDKEKLGVSLAAMLAVQVELKTRLKSKESQLEEVCKDLAVAKANFEAASQAHEKEIAQLDEEVEKLRKEVSTENEHLVQEAQLERREPSKIGFSSQHLVQKLENVGSMIDARVGASTVTNPI